MGTRGAWGWSIDRSEIMTYNHFDSYPEGLGSDLLKYLRGANLDNMRGQVSDLTVIEDAQEQPTTARMAELGVSDQYWNRGVSQGDDWYSILRETQGDPEATLNSGVIIGGGEEFALDSLFCEWAYVIDLDTEFFEVYKGFVTEPHSDGRFADRGEGRESVSDNTYYPVQQIAVYPLNDLPHGAVFVEEVNKLAGYDEEDE